MKPREPAVGQMVSSAVVQTGCGRELVVGRLRLDGLAQPLTRRAASSATGLSSAVSVTATITCGSSASTTVCSPSTRTTTLHGSSSPSRRSTSSAR